MDVTVAKVLIPVSFRVPTPAIPTKIDGFHRAPRQNPMSRVLIIVHDLKYLAQAILPHMQTVAQTSVISLLLPPVFGEKSTEGDGFV